MGWSIRGWQNYSGEDIGEKPALRVRRVVGNLLPNITKASGQLGADGFWRILVGGYIGHCGSLKGGEAVADENREGSFNTSILIPDVTIPFWQNIFFCPPECMFSVNIKIAGEIDRRWCGVCVNQG